MKKMLISMVVLALCVSGAMADDLARFDTYQVKDILTADGYPVDFNGYTQGTVGEGIASASMRLNGVSLPGSPAWNQFSAVGWHDSDSEENAFVLDVQAESGKGFILDKAYIGGMKRSGTGPTTGTISMEYTLMDGTTGSTDLESFSITSSYKNYLLDLSGEFAESNPAVSLQLKMEAAGATGDGGTFRVGNYYDGNNYPAFGITGTVVPEPATMAVMVLGGLAALARRRNR